MYAMAEILFLCTGNLCRSPSAAWFFSRCVQEGGPDGVTVSSAGILAEPGSRVPERLATEGRAVGLDLSGHDPRRVLPADLVRADLIVGMAREHVREVILKDTAFFPRAFTLRELVRRGRERGQRDGEPLGAWLARLHAGRRPMDLIGDSGADDIADPMGGTSEQFRHMLAETAALSEELYELMWP